MPLLRNNMTGKIFKEPDDVFDVCFRPTMARQLEEAFKTGKMPVPDLKSFSTCVEVNTRDIVGHYFTEHLTLYFVSQKEVYYRYYVKACSEIAEEYNILSVMHVRFGGVNFEKEAEEADGQCQDLYLDSLTPDNICEADDGYFVFAYYEKTGIFLGVYVTIPSKLCEKILNSSVKYVCDVCGKAEYTDQTTECMHFSQQLTKRICDECMQKPEFINALERNA